MKKKAWLTYGGWILATEAIGALSGFLTREGVTRYNQTVAKPALTPPSVVFPIVWSVLFLLMGIGAARVFLAPASRERVRALVYYGLQLLFNFFWNIIFFNLQAFDGAFLWLVALWVLILLMILTFRRVDRAAAWLQAPYLLWVTFAAYLSASVWLLNR